jgi:hypothetical protein
MSFRERSSTIANIVNSINDTCKQTSTEFDRWNAIRNHPQHR